MGRNDCRSSSSCSAVYEKCKTGPRGCPGKRGPPGRDGCPGKRGPCGHCGPKGCPGKGGYQQK